MQTTFENFVTKGEMAIHTEQQVSCQFTAILTCMYSCHSESAGVVLAAGLHGFAYKSQSTLFLIHIFLVNSFMKYFEIDWVFNTKVICPSLTL